MVALLGNNRLKTSQLVFTVVKETTRMIQHTYLGTGEGGLQSSLQGSSSALWGLTLKSDKFIGSFLSTWGTQLCICGLTLGLVLPPFSLWV